MKNDLWNQVTDEISTRLPSHSALSSGPGYGQSLAGGASEPAGGVEACVP